MNKVNLQIPVTRELKNSAEQVAIELGFSSLQDSIRLFLTNLAKKSFSVTFVQNQPVLSEKATKRYKKVIQEIRHNQGVHEIRSADDLMNKLK